MVDRINLREPPIRSREMGRRTRRKLNGWPLVGLTFIAWAFILAIVVLSFLSGGKLL